MPAAGTCHIVNYVRERLRGPFQGQEFSACGRHLHYCKLREGPFKAKKDKKFMPAAGTYSIVNYVREGLRGPFKAKNFLPAAGTYIVVN